MKCFLPSGRTNCSERLWERVFDVSMAYPCSGGSLDADIYIDLWERWSRHSGGMLYVGGGDDMQERGERTKNNRTCLSWRPLEKCAPDSHFHRTKAETQETHRMPLSNILRSPPSTTHYTHYHTNTLHHTHHPQHTTLTPSGQHAGSAFARTGAL